MEACVPAGWRDDETTLMINAPSLPGCHVLSWRVPHRAAAFSRDGLLIASLRRGVALLEGGVAFLEGGGAFLEGGGLP